ncbi:hypothetical protein DY000_02020273 [Brassica cretica]|uniref:Uncharacterized protein n=1 Tax=Brassica cretica TaxID=69181 RepID=A0ABQ7EAN6_BRACR|nr:hypothetical protein DY000_02020273 [Brassica cretica]
MAVPTILLADFKSGHYSNTVDLKKGGELMAYVSYGCRHAPRAQCTLLLGSTLHVATQTPSCRIPSSPCGSMMRPPLLRLPTRSIRYYWSCFCSEENLLALANTNTHLPDIGGMYRVGLAKLGELGVGLSKINANNDKLHHFHNELVEFKLLLDKAGDLFASARSHTT